MGVINFFKIGVQSIFKENGFIILIGIILFYIIKYLIINIKNISFKKILLSIVTIVFFITFYLYITLNYKYGCCDLPPARWIGAPLMYLFIPIISIIIDMNIKKVSFNKFTFIRYLVEIIIIYIIWIPFWIFLHFLFGWLYI